MIRRFTESDSAGRRGWIPFAVATVVGVVCYANSFATPFVFDGVPFVRDNSAIRRLWPPGDLFAFSRSRPLGYFTFALNYAVHGTEVGGYHAVNLAVHIALGLFLFGLVDRTLQLPRLRDRFAPHARLLAAFVALIWLAHPLATQAVTNIYQRLESLAALGCMAALYGFVRGATCDATPARRRWFALSIVSLAAAAAVKETACVAPLVIAWYDRVFLADSWSGALRLRGRYYLLLGAVGLLQAGLVWAQRELYPLGGIFVVEGVSPLRYALNQPAVIARYLRLVVWPVGQCFDYAWRPAESAAPLVIPLAAALGVIGATLYGLARGRAWSFLPGAFLLLLAPTSSFVPIVDLAVEHRMYLPSALVIAAIVLGGYRLVVRMAAAFPTMTHSAFATGRKPAVAIAVGAAAVVSALSALTIARNTVYDSELTLWTDVLRTAPHNSRAYANLAVVHLQDRDFETADRCCRQAIALDPRAPLPHYTLGNSNYRRKRYDQAEACYRRALELRPDDAETWIALGMTFGVRERRDEAADCFRKALSIVPDHPAARRYLSLVAQKNKPHAGAHT